MRKFIDWLEKGNNCLVISFVVATFIYIISNHLATEIRILVTYNTGLLNYISLLLIVVEKGNKKQLLKFLKNKKNNIRFLVIFAIICFLVNLAIVAFILGAAKDLTPLFQAIHLILSITAILLSWFLVHFGFSLTYAHLYYENLEKDNQKEEQLHRRGLDFPQEEPPIFWDFMYFAFVIAMCFQTSDVAITNSLIRRYVLAHSLISFLFVSGIFGMLINIIASVI